jgi:hypothetical protein
LLCCGLGLELLFLNWLPDKNHPHGNNEGVHSGTIVAKAIEQTVS